MIGHERKREEFQEQIDFLLWMKSPHLTRLEVRARQDEGARAQALLAESAVRLFGEGRAADHLDALLEAAGVVRRSRASAPDDAGEATINIYCPDHFDEAFAQRLNQASIRAGVPVVFYRSRGLEVECGPLVIPGDTACYRCLLIRRAGLLSPLERVWLQRTESVGSLRFPLAVEFLALEIITFLAKIGEPALQGRLWRLSLRGGEATTHAILRLPRCPDCRPADERPPLKIWTEHA